MKTLNNSSYIKLMWLPELDESILWMRDENKLNKKDIFRKINDFLDLKNWHREYEVLYRKWLRDDSQELYYIKNNIHLNAINKIEELNIELKDLRLFYWFDVDRSKEINENFIWKTCPLSQLPLIELASVHPNNKFISPKFPIVFPK